MTPRVPDDLLDRLARALADVLVRERAEQERRDRLRERAAGAPTPGEARWR